VLGYMGAGHFRMMLLMIMPLQSVLPVSELRTLPFPESGWGSGSLEVGATRLAS